MTGREVRRVPGGRRTFRWEVTESDPGRRWGLRGIDGPVRAHVTVALAPTLGGAGTHVDYAIWFEGHGIGKLIRLLAQQGARKDVPASLALLKQRLELATRTPEGSHRTSAAWWRRSPANEAFGAGAACTGKAPHR